jgi:hypothetical protein
MKRLTREQKIERVVEATTKTIEKMVKDGKSAEEISQYNIIQLNIIANIK